MSIVQGAWVAVVLSALALAGCSSDVQAQPVTAAGEATPCSPSQCGGRPIATQHRCKDGSYAGVQACVHNDGALCAWQVTSCGSGSGS